MTLGLAQRLMDSPSMQSEIIHRYFDQYDFNLRCAAPGIIKKFDKDKQTVSVQLVIKDIISLDTKNGREVKSIQIPLLKDVPIVIPRAGGFSITLPIKEDDECLVIFADSHIDAWWQNGDIQEPMSARRHDLSDGFAILGTWSQPNVIDTYNVDDLEIRNEDGKTKIQVKDDTVKIVVNEDTFITVKDKEITITSSSKIDIKSTGAMNIESESTMDIKSTGVMTVNSEGTLDIKSTGDVSIGGTSITIAEGMLGVARIGDAVAVNTSTGIGTITAGSLLVKAG